MENGLNAAGRVEETDLTEIARPTPVLLSHAPLEAAARILHDLELDFLPVAEAGEVIGICSRVAVGSLLGTRFGFALKGKARVDEFTERESLLVNVDQPVLEVLQLVLTRGENVFNHDAILLDEAGGYRGMLKASDLANLQNLLVEEKIRHLQCRRSELEEANRQLSEMAEQLQVSNAALEKARDEGLQAARAKSEFLAVMSHEIRTPLNGVLGMLNLLVDSPLQEEQAELAKAATDSAEALLSILNDILDFSRLDSGKVDLEIRAFDIRELAESVVSLMAESANESEVEIYCDVDCDVPSIAEGDGSRLRQVLANLLGNAIKFTRRGEVRLRMTRKGERSLCIEIVDTGIGISPEAQGRLFQPFAQADSSTTRKFGGTGLGLAICHRLVSVMGGSIGVKSEEGKGSVFWLVLPLLDEAGSAERKYRPEASYERVAALALISNDTEAEIVGRELELRGIAVDRCATTEAFCEAARKNLVERRICIAEERLWKAVERPEFAKFPRILLRPSHSCPRDNRTTLEHWLRKPFRPSQLDRCLAKILGNASALAEARTSPDELEGNDEGNAFEGRLLLVEDHEINRRLATKLLKRLGYRCDVADDGAAALERVKEEAYRLILLDCQMPRMDGYAFTRELRRLEASNAERTPAYIIALTANALSGDRELCIASGMDDYLSKPLDKSDLKAAIERGLAKVKVAGAGI